MKNILFIIIVAISLGVNAQIEAGKIIAGGSVGFSSQGGTNDNTSGNTTVSTKNNSTFAFNFLPQAGYMLSDNIGVGTGIGYDYSKTTMYDALGSGTSTFDNVLKNGMFYISPFVRYYKNTGDKAYAFGEFALPIGTGSYNDLRMNTAGTGTEDNDPTKVFSFAAQLSIGFNYFLNDRCALEAKWAGLKYQTTSYKQEGTTGNVSWENKRKDNYFGLNLDMTAISVGLRIFL